MSRSAAVFIAARSGKWLSEGRPRDVRCPLMNAGSHPSGEPYPGGQPRGPPPYQKIALGRSAAGPATSDQTANDRDDDVNKSVASRQPRVLSILSARVCSDPRLTPGSRTRREHDKEQTMLALQAITPGLHSVQALLIAISVLIALFWRAALKIIFFLLVIATLVTITLGAATVLSLLAHVIK